MLCAALTPQYPKSIHNQLSFNSINFFSSGDSPGRAAKGTSARQNCQKQCRVRKHAGAWPTEEIVQMHGQELLIHVRRPREICQAH
jgi:hypothetical protein